MLPGTHIHKENLHVGNASVSLLCLPPGIRLSRTDPWRLAPPEPWACVSPPHCTINAAL